MRNLKNWDNQNMDEGRHRGKLVLAVVLAFGITSLLAAAFTAFMYLLMNYWR